ncbi:MAG: 7TM domain-containing protein [Bacteroidota bacterium]
MNSLNHFRIIFGSLLMIAIILLVYKMVAISDKIGDFYPEERFTVNYQYFLRTNDEFAKVKSFLPKNSDRQRITSEQNKLEPDVVFNKKGEGNNLRGLWTVTTPNAYTKIDYSFEFQGKSKSFVLPEKFQSHSTVDQRYFKSTEYIQKDHPKIEALTNSIAEKKSSDKKVITALFDYVHQIPNEPIITLTDALSALEQNMASCNGKSRLLVALSRHLGYAARLKGGMILNTANTRQSHAWVEIYINDQWIPFDTVNNHFAYIPANYLELYENDEFLLTHSTDISFDYNYEIKQQINVPFIDASSKEISAMIPFSLLRLLDQGILSAKSLILLLLLPLGGFIVALLRNVVGLKTFGVFLPVLIAFSLLKTGFILGISIFLFLIFFIGLISQPFSKLGLLHTPKLVISLTLMVVIIITGSYVGVITNNIWLGSLSFFPIIILTISAERFSTFILEDGFGKATNMLFQTLIAVSVCYLLLSSNILASALIIFPEILLIIVVLSMFLGRYVGLRWSELIRFNPILNLKTIS